MSARRGAGEGSLYYSDNRGRWVGIVDLGRGPNGKRQRSQITGRTRREAREKLKQLRTKTDAGVRADGRLTVAAWLDRWSDTLGGRVAPATEGLHRDNVRLHLKPQLGANRIDKLTVADCDQVWSRKLQTLSPNTVRLIRATLSKALSAAEREGLIPRNVAAGSQPIRIPAPQGRALTVEQSRQLLAIARTDRLYAAYLIGISYGLRRGELLGLRWIDLDSRRETLAVRQAVKRERNPAGQSGSRSRLVIGELKGAKSARTLQLTAPVLDALRLHRKLQAAERLAVGAAWQDTGLIFTTTIGTVVEPRNFYRGFTKLTQRAGLGHWHPHELRHSAASVMLGMGVPLHVVSEVLGHQSIVLTMNTYGHLIGGMHRDAAETMSRALAGTS